MTDKEALNVTYRVDRGEPRGRHKKGDSWDGRGDCIDCKACVAACPMGIDIRNGSQLECIGCALCIDACDDIMVKVGRPKGLIGYDTDDNVDRREEGLKPRYRLIRTRTIVYATAFLIVSAVMLFGLMSRVELELNVTRDRNPNYVTLSDGSVRNGYTLTVLNKTPADRQLQVMVLGPGRLGMRILGADESGTEIMAGADDTSDVRIFLTLPAESIDAASANLTFVVEDVLTGDRAETVSVFQTGQ